MKLEGIHHITAITGDAPRNVDFYARVLGLRMVKKTVNQDDPTVYPLLYGDEEGATGHDITRVESRGAERGGRILYDTTEARGVPGAGTVHHVAWAIELGKEGEWRERVVSGGAHPTPVIDRYWFHSIYFREPSGVLFELATRGPGFTADEPLETLGEGLSLPPDYEQLRDRLEGVLTPLPDTRPWRRAGREAPTG